jgi:hypothetical protein
LHIVNTDKNLGPAIMLTSDYVDFCLNHLRSPSYQRVQNIPMDNIRNAIRQLHNTIIEEFENEKKEARILIHNLDSTTPPYFHALPKIHKSPMGCRPIVSNVNAPTEGLSKWLTVKLRNYVRSCSSFVKDSRTAQLQITALPVDSNDIMYTMDIESMYTNIPTEAALKAIDWFLLTRNDPLREIIMQGLSIILNATYFTFGDSIWKQVHGIAMGTPVPPIIATLFVGFYEETSIIPIFSANIRLYLRYLDDIFIVWNHRQDPFSFNKFRAKLRQIPGLSWTFEKHPTEATFLDLCVYRHQHRYFTRTHQKALNLYLYPVANSAHPPGVQSGMIYGLILKYYQQNSDSKEFYNIVKLFYLRLLARGYKASYLKPIFMRTIKHITNSTPVVKTRDRTLFYKIPYDPNGPSREFIRKGLGLNELSETLENDQAGRIIVCYQRPRNLGELITRTRHSSPLADTQTVQAIEDLTTLTLTET